MWNSALALAACVALTGSCVPEPEHFDPTAIVRGDATIVAVEARTVNGQTVLADLSSSQHGMLGVGSDMLVHGSVTIDSTAHLVSGEVKQEGNGLYFETPSLPPGRFLVRIDPAVGSRYQLLAMYDQHGDVTGDAVSDTYRTLYYMQK